MTRIALVVSDVDGTMVTKDKVLTDKARAAVQKLHDAGIGFTITSSRPPVGMRFLIEPLGITLPIGPFNGSSMVDDQLKPISQHLIPQPAAQRAIELLDQYGIDIWLFTNDEWLIKRDDGKYVPHEQNTIQHDPVIVDDFTPYLTKACKIVGASADFPLVERCETAMQQALGDSAVAVRSQDYYLDITPPGQNKGTFVKAMAQRLNISLAAIATIGDMQNDLPMFMVAGMSVAMGNATDQVKALASDVTTSNEDEGFAGAVELILRRNAGG
ncbi:MAG: Cof protein [Tardiphaga sp.]|nr:Cof protein [Tardiphaga sp.]